MVLTGGLHLGVKSHSALADYGQNPPRKLRGCFSKTSSPRRTKHVAKLMVVDAAFMRLSACKVRTTQYDVIQAENGRGGQA
jgi:hypothetical protein